MALLAHHILFAILVLQKLLILTQSIDIKVAFSLTIVQHAKVSVYIKPSKLCYKLRYPVLYT